VASKDYFKCNDIYRFRIPLSGNSQTCPPARTMRCRRTTQPSQAAKLRSGGRPCSITRAAGGAQKKLLHHENLQRDQQPDEGQRKFSANESYRTISFSLAHADCYEHFIKDCLERLSLPAPYFLELNAAVLRGVYLCNNALKSRVPKRGLQ
jgi:hypothetical protein